MAVRPHWILRLQNAARAVLDQLADDRFYDGIVIGIAAATVPFIVWLWWSGR